MIETASLLAVLHGDKKILLTGHSDPDGDCLGAIAGLFFLLQGKNVRVTGIIEGPVPDRLSFLLPEEIIVIEGGEQKLPEIEADLAIIVDSGDLKRLGRVGEIIEGLEIINIDHHPDNEYFGDINLVDEKASSACEILGLNLRDKIHLPPRVMEAWTAGILYDTGGLRHPNTRKETLALLANWMATGMELHIVQEKLFGRQSRPSFALFQKALQSLRFSRDGQLAWTVIKEEKEGPSPREVSQKVIDEMRSIAGVEIAIVFVDQEQRTKISFRSRNFPVNDIAARWGGGGHVRAAGVTLEKPFADVYPEILNTVEEKIDEWNN